MYKKIDMHVHVDDCRFPKSWKNPYDFDHAMKGNPKRVILSAAKKVDGIVIAQQNNLQSSQEAVEICKQLKKQHKIPETFLAYAAEEIATRRGEFIGVGHQEGVGPYDDLQEAMDRVIEQGGVVIADHPLTDMKATEDLVPLGLGKSVLENPEIRKRLSGIEVLNYSAYAAAMLSKKYRMQLEETFKLQKYLGINPIGGTDNHFSIAGLAYTLFESDDIIHELRKGKTRVGLTNRGWPNPLFYLKFVTFYLTDSSSMRHTFKSFSI